MVNAIAEETLPPQTVFNHSRVALVVRPAKLVYVASQQIEGVLEISCSSDKVWLGRIALELRGQEQLQSLDHAASQAFLQAEVTFQDSSLPPSNAVVATAASRSGYWPARPGTCRFPFSFLLPAGAPSACRFANNASVSYNLLATAQVSYQNERSILTKKLDLDVVERWDDWQDERFHEPSEAQKKEKLSGLGFGKTEGSIWVDAAIQDSFFFRGWENAEGRLIRERARGEVGVTISVKNGTNRSISGIKLSLLRRLKIVSPPGIDGKTVESKGPRVTETADEVHFEGREWEFPASGDERTVQCHIDLPKKEKLMSIRKARLFEVQTFLRVAVETGMMSKDIVLELPIWVAHWASLPAEALVPKPQPQSPMPMHGQTSGHPGWGMAPPAAGSQSPAQGSYPGCRPPSAAPPLAGGYSPNLHQSMTSPALSRSPEPIQYIQFDPYAPELTQSRFFQELHVQSHPALPSQQQRPASWLAYGSNQHGPPMPQMQQQSAYFNANQGPFQQRPASAQPNLQSRNAISSPERSLSPMLREALTEEEQARVIANSAPAYYDVTERARAQQQQGVTYEGGTSLRTQPGTTRYRRQSMPAPAPPPTPQQAPAHGVPLTRSSSFDPYLPPSRPIKTPPPAPSTSSRFMSPELVSSSPVFAHGFEAAMSSDPSGLETIGEDGESQAGTTRMKTLPRGAQVPSIAEVFDDPGVRSLKAIRSAQDDEGNTSATRLEDLVEAQEKKTKMLRAAAVSPDKTLPKPPVPSGKQTKSTNAKPHVLDIFPFQDVDKQKSVDASTSAKGRYPSRRISAPQVQQPIKPRPVLPSSRSEGGLHLLETRLSRPSSPISSAEEPIFRPMSMSPPTPHTNTSARDSRSGAISPIQRAMSPTHIGNEGALRKKSSQISLKRSQSQNSTVSKPYAVEAKEMHSCGRDHAKAAEVAKRLPADDKAKTELKATERKADAPKAKKVDVQSSVLSNVQLSAEGKSRAAKAKESAARIRDKLDRQEQAKKETPAAKLAAEYKATAAKSDSSDKGARKTAEQALEERQIVRNGASDKVEGWLSGKDAPLIRQKTTTSDGVNADLSAKKAVSKSGAKSAGLSNGKAAVPGKPVASGPAAPPLIKSIASPKPTAATRGKTQIGVEDQASTGNKENRRRSLDVPDVTGKYDVRSARGGRGGVVTAVATQWQSIVTSEESAAGADLVQSPPLAFANAQKRTTSVQDLHERMLARTTSPALPSTEARLSPRVVAGIEVRTTVVPAMAFLANKTKASTSTSPFSPKASAAKTFVNTTMGKSPTFAASPTRAVSDPVLTKSVSAQSGAEPWKEQATGPGTDKLRALIQKFS